MASRIDRDLGERDPVDDELAHLPARRDRERRPKPAGSCPSRRRAPRSARRAAGTPRPPPRCRWRNSARAAGTSAPRPARRRSRRRRRRAGWRRADARPPAWRARTADRRRARRRPAGRPRRARHSRPADSTGSPARRRRRFRRAAAGRRGPPTTAPRRARRTRATTIAVPIRLDQLECWTRMSLTLIRCTLGNRPCGPQRQHDQEGDVAGQQIPAGIELRADGLRDAEDDAAGERAPHAAEPADDHGLEAEDQPRRADRRIEVGAHGEQHAGDRDDGERQRHRQREHVAVVRGP